jgi:hypothetical protein
MKSRRMKCVIIVSVINTVLFSSFLFFTTIINGTGSSKNINGDNEQRADVFGILTTHQGQKDSVHTISIGGKNKDIIMYDCPLTHAEEIINAETKQPEIKLDANPATDYVQEKINLCAVREIRVPKPNTIWYYQKEHKHQRLDFTQVEILKQNTDIPKLYLLEHKTHIDCSSIDKSGLQKKRVPLTAVETLVIEGYGEKKEIPACPGKKEKP